jgi:plastocyanin
MQGRGLWQPARAGAGLATAFVLLSVATVPLAAQGTGAAVSMTEPSPDRYAFTPDATTIAAGAAVTWTNRSDAPHTVTSDTGAFASGRLNADQTFRFTFARPGAYAYHCTVHPYMHGTITVAAAAGAGAQTAPAPGGAGLPRTGGSGADVRGLAATAALVVASAGATLTRLRHRR